MSPAAQRPPTVANSPAARGGWLVVVLLGVAAALRLREATRSPQWFDETYSLWVARLGFPGMMRAIAADIHPPLHFMLLSWWRALGGESDAWLRGSSVVFGVATVLAAWWLARRAFGAEAGWVAGALLAFHRTHIHFSQEVRFYAMLWLLYTLAVAAAMRWLERGRRGDAALYVAAVALAFYTHYQSLLVIGCVGLWGVIALAREPRRLAAWVGLHALALAAFLPIAPMFVHQFTQNRDSHWIQPPHPGDVLTLLRHMSFGAIYLVPPLLALAALPLFRGDAVHRRRASLLWTFAFLPIAISYLLTARGGHLYAERYMFYALPAWCVLIAAGFASLPWRQLRVVAALGLVGLAARSWVLSEPYAEAVELGRAASSVSARLRPGDVVFSADTHSLYFFMQYLPHAARYRLLLTQPGLPYYEGAVFVPDSIRATPAQFDSVRAAGGAWWGVHARHAGIDTRPALEMLKAHATTIEHPGRIVTVVYGQSDSSAAGRRDSSASRPVSGGSTR